MKKIASITIFSFICIVCQSCFADTILVPQDYQSISEAVNNALEGDTVLVGNGTYDEEISISTAITLQSVNGPETTLLTGPGVLISYNNVSIIGFTAVEISSLNNSNITIKNNHAQRIRLENVNDSKIVGNQIEHTECPLLFRNSSNNTISDNVIINSEWGSFFINSFDNNIENNTFDSIDRQPIYFRTSSDNTVKKNKFSNFGACIENSNIYENNVFDGTMITGGCPVDSNNIAIAVPPSSVTQSSSAYGRTGEEAIDGVTNGDFRVGSVTCTDSYPNPNYLTFQFVYYYNIEKITLWNRTDCCSERLSDFFIEVQIDGQWQEVVHEEGAVGESATYNLNNVQTNALRIRMDRIEFLSLAEVQIFGQDAP